MNLYVRIESDVKALAEDILATLDIPTSNAINMFYKQIILQKDIYFDVKIPNSNFLDAQILSEAEMNLALEKELLAGKLTSAKNVFADH